jgi:hypothetical protein
MEKMKRHTDPDAPERAAPGLLVMFLAATLVIVAAVVAIGLTDSDWLLAGAIVLLALALAVLLATLHRLLLDGDASPSNGGTAQPDE